MSKENKHTKGQWKVETWDYPHANPPRKDLSICTDNIRIAVIESAHDQENPYTVQKKEAEANARLIAAAPDMLSAIERFLAGVEAHADSYLKLRLSIHTDRMKKVVKQAKWAEQ